MLPCRERESGRSKRRHGDVHDETGTGLNRGRRHQASELQKPAKSLLDSVVVDTKMPRDSSDPDTLSPQLGRLEGDTPVDAQRRHLYEVHHERRPGQGANAFLPGPRPSAGSVRRQRRPGDVW